MMTNPTGRLTQGQFSFLPDLTDAEISLQIEYGLKKGYAWSIEYTDDPHPRNTYWEMFGNPMFDLNDAAGVMLELKSCRDTFPQHYIRLVAFDSTRGVETIAMSFIVNRPAVEPGFGLVRQETNGRTMRYTIRGYEADQRGRRAVRQEVSAAAATSENGARRCTTFPGLSPLPPLPLQRERSRAARVRALKNPALTPSWRPSPQPSPTGVGEGAGTEGVRKARTVAEVMAQSQAGGVLDELDRDLVGLAPVKARIRDIAALLVIDRLRMNQGLQAQTPSLHMSFTGNPGTGKTTVALRMAQILHRLGYIRKGHLVAVTRDDLVGQYVGHTAPKTREVLKKAMGGVLFIDEAYYLYRPDNERDYGQEAIEILMQVMENNRDDLVVILAGYGDRMETFFQSNPGMRSRIAHHLEFPDFAEPELLRIGEMMLEQQNYRFGPGARDVFAQYIAHRIRQPQFANARSVRNALDRARLRQASRLFANPDKELTVDDLSTIESPDILASRVFGQPSPQPSPAKAGEGASPHPSPLPRKRKRESKEGCRHASRPHHTVEVPDPATRGH